MSTLVLILQHTLRECCAGFKHGHFVQNCLTVAACTGGASAARVSAYRNATLFMEAQEDCGSSLDGIIEAVGTILACSGLDMPCDILAECVSVVHVAVVIGLLIIVFPSAAASKINEI